MDYFLSKIICYLEYLRDANTSISSSTDIMMTELTTTITATAHDGKGRETGLRPLLDIFCGGGSKIVQYQTIPLFAAVCGCITCTVK